MARQASVLLDSRVLRTMSVSWFPLPWSFFVSVEVVEVRVRREVVQALAHLALRTTYDLRSRRERING